MLKQISIQNFKGILQCKIADFNFINVFIGEFGSGKSTVLDAIYLLKISTEKSNCLKRVISRRTKRAVDLSSLWYNYETDHEAMVRHGFGQTSYEIDFSERDGQVNVSTRTDEGTGGAMDSSYRWNGDSYLTESFSKVPEEIFAAKITLLDSETLASVVDIERKVLDPMKQKRLDQKMLNLLTQAFPTCRDFGFRSASPRQQQDFRCYLDFGDSRVLIDDVSDGLRNGLAILSTACMLTDTALLLEEPENNIYPKALDSLLKALVEVCSKNRIQLFVTTHRPEVLASFVEHGKEKATIFHFSRSGGEVRARPSQWNDTKILLDIGWDVGKLVKGYEKLVIVEGDRDKLLLEESFRKVRGTLPENLWITIIPARGLDGNVPVVLKAILPTEREVFVLPDQDNQTVEKRRQQIIQSVKQLGSEGFDVSQTEDALTLAKGNTRITLRAMNILPLGDPEILRARGFNFQSSSMDDYLLATILLNPRVQETLGISEQDVNSGKRCKNSKSVVEEVMRIDDERLRTLIRDSVLPDSLIQVINMIVGDGKAVQLD